jgi:enoyl-CoA hydratase/carnithine racemase
MSEAVRYTRAGAIGVITLDRPDNRNSMTPELLDAFSAASKQAREDRDARCVVITGTGTSFSAGADFKSQLQRANPDHAPSERSFAMYEPFLSVLDIPVPVIGALNGHAVGGGFGLALVCDLRVGSTEAKYGANFVRLGLAPGMAISYLLPRLVGVARASELLYTGKLMSGEEALAMGFLNRAVDSMAVMSVALVLANSIAEGAPLAIRATKAAIRRGLELHVREAARAEAYAQAETVATADAHEGIAALLEKRPPIFTGR